MNTQLNVDEFSETLSEINSLYECFSRCCGVSSHLEVIKIESGSLLAKLIGDDNIISAIGNLLNKFIDWFYNKFTYEGKLARIADIKEALEGIFEFSQVLKENGLNVESIENDLQETT